jgi:hypothetical protein
VCSIKKISGHCFVRQTQVESTTLISSKSSKEWSGPKSDFISNIHFFSNYLLLIYVLGTDLGNGNVEKYMNLRSRGISVLMRRNSN